VDAALVFSALMLGLAGMPHCAAMCGAPCAAVIGSGPQARSRALGFHVARLAGYAAAGGLLAAGAGVLSLAGAAGQWMRPLWAVLHMGALALGLWLLVMARQPAFMTGLGRSRHPAPAVATGWAVVRTPWTAAAAGSAWVAWPCGLLQSALVVAMLCHTPASGALAMAAFAAASAGGLQAAPWLLGRLGRRGDAPLSWAIRLAGLALVLGSGWALGHDLWARIAAYCAS
jgi:sulfite exporter TauE/SafE